MTEHLLVWLITAFVVLFGNTGVNSQSEISYRIRLPSQITPVHYDVYLAYHLDEQDKFPFFGLVKIEFITNVFIDHLVVHVDNNITIRNNSVRIVETHNKNNSILIKYIITNTKWDIIAITTASALQPGLSYTIKIPFQGNLTMEPKGAYVRQLRKSDDYVLLTNFIPDSARRAFPCFDEPNLKATFNISIAHHRSLAAIFNMHIVKQTNEYLLSNFWSLREIAKTFRVAPTLFFEYWVWDCYATSFPMSTYMLAWVVTGFSYVNALEGQGNINVRFWARKESFRKLGYAQKVTSILLRYYENLFNLRYPLQKLDIFVVPGQYTDVAKRVGLITLSESHLIIDPNQKTEERNEYTTKVIASSLIHMWLGNVSFGSDSWNDYWIYEGLTRYLSIRGKNEFNPKWDDEDVDVADLFYPVYEKDNIKCNPLDEKITNGTIVDHFDEIAYERGAVLFLMLNRFLENEIFYKGLSKYFVKYANTINGIKDLWKEFTSAARLKWVLPSPRVSVTKIMNSWTKNCSLTLIYAFRPEYDRALVIEQTRFIKSRSQNPGEELRRYAPLEILSKSENVYRLDKRLWLEPVLGQIFAHTAPPIYWVLVNPTMMAPVRIMYDLKNWDLLIMTLLNPRDLNTIPIQARVQLIHDVVGLAAADKLSYTVACRLLLYLRHEDKYAPMKTGLNLLWSLGRRLFKEPKYPVYKKYMKKILGPSFQSIDGLDYINASESVQRIRMRVLIAHYACLFDAGGCSAIAKTKFAVWMDSTNPDENNTIPYDFRPIVYCSAIKDGNLTEWEFLLKRRSNSDMPWEKTIISEAMACTRDGWVLDQYLGMALNGTLDFHWKVIFAMAKQPHSYSKVLELLFTGMDKLKDKTGRYENLGKSLLKQHLKMEPNSTIYRQRRLREYIGLLLKELTAHITSDEEIDKLLKWLEKNRDLLDSNDSNVSTGISQAKLTVAWLKTKKQRALSGFKSYSRRSIVIRTMFPDNEWKVVVPISQCHVHIPNTSLIRTFVTLTIIFRLYRGGMS